MSAFALSASPGGSWTHSFRVCASLVWNDCKQGLRKHLAGATRRDKWLRAGGALFGLAFLAALHLAAYSLLIYAGAGYLEAPTSADSHGMRDLLRGVGTSVWCFLLFVMISGGLVRALVVLHEQDDSSLLLSSPVSPRAILAARLFGNALQSCLVDGFIIVPWINVLVFVFGHWECLWGYAVWFALAVIVTCIDGLFSFGLIAWLGLRRARFLSQAVPFLLVFGVAYFSGTLSISVAEMNVGEQRQMPPELQAHFIALSHTPLVWITRASAGNPLFLAMIFSAAAALAMLTLRLTERAFVEGTQHLAEDAGSARPGTADAPFRSGVLRLEVRKNLLLIVRTPMMMVQCVAQSLIPIGIAWYLGHENVARAVAFFVIFASGILSGMFTIAAGTVEECDDLLAMSPCRARLFRYGKMLSGSLCPLGFVLVVAAGLLLDGEPLLAAAVFFGGIPLGLASSVAGETFATPVKPGTRPKLLADPIMMIPLLGMQIVSGLVSGLTVFAAAFSWYFLLLSLLASYLLLILAIGLAQLRKPLF
jgi:ABC-2 type transport system permease protein